jgi:nitrile hydratase
MSDHGNTHPNITSVEQRVAAIEAAFDERGMAPGEVISEFQHTVDEQWVPQNGARVVAKAWTDPEFRRHLARQRRDDGCQLDTHAARVITGIVVLKTPRRFRTSSAARFAPARPSRSSPAAGLYKGSGSFAPYRPAVRTVLREMGLDPAARSRDTRLGYDGRHPLYDVCRYGRPKPWAGPKPAGADRHAGSMIGVARL